MRLLIIAAAGAMYGIGIGEATRGGWFIVLLAVVTPLAALFAAHLLMAWYRTRRESGDFRWWKP